MFFPESLALEGYRFPYTAPCRGVRSCAHRARTRARAIRYMRARTVRARARTRARNFGRAKLAFCAIRVCTHDSRARIRAPENTKNRVIVSGFAKNRAIFKANSAYVYAIRALSGERTFSLSAWDLGRFAFFRVIRTACALFRAFLSAHFGRIVPGIWVGRALRIERVFANHRGVRGFRAIFARSKTARAAVFRA